MRVGLELNSNVKNEYKINVENTNFEMTSINNSISVDLNSNSVNIDVYKDKKKNVEDIMAEAESINVESARNYMTVLSNTMSAEDYQKAMEDGFDPSKMKAEEAISIVDHIKAVVAESGVVIEGYNDDLDSNILKDVTGKDYNRITIKEALKDEDLPIYDDNINKIEENINLLKDITSFSDNNIEYMVENDLEPTIENIYMSKYSAISNISHQSRGYYSDNSMGYYAKKADNIEWEEILPQIEKKIDMMNIESIDKNIQVEDAKWLLEKGIPISEEKICEYEDIKKINFPIELPRIIKASISAMKMGLEPKKGNLINEKDVYTDSFKYKEALLEASINREEARLDMYLDANISLQKRGILLDTYSVEDAINLLKEEEQKLKEQFFGEGSVDEIDNKANIFSKTNNIVKEMAALPLSTVGWFTDTEDSSTIINVYNKGIELKNEYEKASIQYEEMGTKIRNDLGDSIKKAFRNVDDILDDLKLNKSVENERAVRILGYNSMDINADSIKNIVRVDNKLQTIINGLTPGKTLNLIRDGINPLTLSLDELISDIESYDDNPQKNFEKYSKFLYKLEKNNEISEEEKESYIGIYRLINTIEKTDHAAIGSLLNSGTDITFGNLLTAIRSSKKKIDVSINDDFGLLDNTISNGSSITEQILAAFDNNLSGDTNNELENEYNKEQLEEIRKNIKAEDEVYEELINHNIPTTSDNLEAESVFYSDQNSLFRKLMGFSKNNDGNKKEENREKLLESQIEEFPEALTDKETAKESYIDLIKSCSSELEIVQYEEINNYIDLKSLSTMHKQLSLAVDYAKEENYHIPVLLDGNITDINLKIVHGGEGGKVLTSFESEKYGKISSRYEIIGNSVESMQFCENSECIGFLDQIGKSMENYLYNEGYERLSTSNLIGNPERTGKLSSRNDDNNNESIETSVLYKIAKEYIKTIKLQSLIKEK